MASRSNKVSDKMLRKSPSVCLLAGALMGLSSCVDGSNGADGTRSTDEGATISSAPLPEGAQARSFTGRALFPPDFPDEVRAVYDANLVTALADLEASPEDADALIWAGRRYGYLAHYRTAIDLFTSGAELFPDDARFLRHRGHRYLSVRELDRAVEDFRQAAGLIQGQADEVEPDGLPNARGIPTSTLQFNIWYHLGLAHYLKGDFELARAAYLELMAVSKNNDAVVAASYWLYMTLVRLGRDEEAREALTPINADLDIIENGAYLDLLLLFKGERTPDDLLGPGGEETLNGATLGYGIGFWYVMAGDTERAAQIFDQVVAVEAQWAAFGYIASEVEAIRLAGA